MKVIVKIIESSCREVHNHLHRCIVLPVMLCEWYHVYTESSSRLPLLSHTPPLSSPVVMGTRESVLHYMSVEQLPSGEAAEMLPTSTPRQRREKRMNCVSDYE